ncbi:hypothetical protein [Halobacteriovorax sp. CON-3]|uniref:hypothetical protein n=1 Tax=Halobacteriovorax sp. CON-3 TaxID=3157710 RepID=UPI003721B591
MRIIIRLLILIIVSTNAIASNEFDTKKYESSAGYMGAAYEFIYFPENDTGKGRLKYGKGTMYHIKSRECASLYATMGQARNIKKIGCPKHVLDKLKRNEEVRIHNTWEDFKADFKNCLTKEDIDCLRGLISPKVKYNPGSFGHFLNKEELLRNRLESRHFQFLLGKLDSFKKGKSSSDLYFYYEDKYYDIFIEAYSIPNTNQKTLVITRFFTQTF